MKAVFEFELDYIPPPKANRYLNGKNGVRYLPDRIRSSIDDTILLLRNAKQMQGLKTIDYTVLADVLFIFPDKRRRDLDNIFKTLGDCLEKAGIIKDDSLIVKKIIEKALSKNKQAKTIIKIYPYQIRKI